jgi:serine/threonine protein kinase
MGRPNWIGQTLGGRYRIDELLGQGGMSAVYKAYDPNLKRAVAVKMIHPHLADDPKFLVRFEEEATAVAKLRHPNIAQVFDFNHDGDLYYMVQEFIPGETLQERLRRLNRSGKRMRVSDAIHYAVNISDATGYAHRLGMIHRDIKPANIMLDVHDQAILMDFGIVKMTGGERHTATGAVVGTALYLPPELIRGELPDPRSDLYSLGITLFEMVSGRPPFEADSAMTLMMMHLHDSVPDLRDLRPEVPEEVIAVIDKSFSKDRDKRYASMAELAGALKRAAGQIQAARQPTAEEAALSPAPGYQAETVDGEKTLVDIPEVESTAAESIEFSQPVVAAAPTGGQVLFSEADSRPTEFEIESAQSPGQESGATLADQPPSIQSAKGSTSRPSDPFSALEVSSPAGEFRPTLRSTPPPGIADKRSTLPTIWIGGGFLGLVVLVVLFFAFRGMDVRSGDPGLPLAVDLPSTTGAAPLAAAAFTETPAPSPTLSPAPTFTPTITPTSPPTSTPTPTLSPTPTIPPGVPYAYINGIRLRDQNYVVEYETFEYTEALPGMHVHFFFNTVLPEEAGSPGKGPWYLYGGPRPFDDVTVSERPQFATQMCILVANQDHSIQFDTGNCYTLPDIVAIAAGKDMACRAGPAEDYPVAAQLSAGQVLLGLGISPDESWWNVTHPQKQGETCWLPWSESTFSGDISKLALVEPPPKATGPFVLIQDITLDEQNRYVVEFEPQGFTPQLPGTHIHFYFNVFTANQVGMSGGGSRLMFGGPAPFTGYGSGDRPAAATEMCALVANPDHSVIPDSGTCFKLPDVAP